MRFLITQLLHLPLRMADTVLQAGQHTVEMGSHSTTDHQLRWRQSCRAMGRGTVTEQEPLQLCVEIAIALLLV